MEINDNTRIGFYSASGLGYCTKCKKIFRYYYNYYQGLLKGEGNCPDCGAGKKYEDVIRSQNLEMILMLTHSMSHNIFFDEKQRYELAKDYEELVRVKKLFGEFEEKEHEGT